MLLNLLYFLCNCDITYFKMYCSFLANVWCMWDLVKINYIVCVHENEGACHLVQ